MATAWNALNILEDSDDDSDAVDNTQEIQIEEALKLHQKALKLHSENEWEEAAKTFEELFKSELFENSHEDDTLRLKNILYLSYRAHAEFKLDYLKAQGDNLSPTVIRTMVQQCLLWFAEALSRDSNDAFLWRKMAQLARILDSDRMSRFALESVFTPRLEGESSPEELLASLQLRDTLQEVYDEASLSRPRFRNLLNKKINPRVAKYIEIYPWLKIPKNELEDEKRPETGRDILAVSEADWKTVGSALYESLEDLENSERASSRISKPLFISLPGLDIELSDEADEAEDETVTENVTTQQNTDDVAMTDSGEPESRPERPELRRRSTSTTNKRKSTAALDAENNNVRASKRVRNRESNAAAVAASVPASMERGIEAMDELLFLTANRLLESYGVEMGEASSLRPDLKKDDGDDSDINDRPELYVKDFKNILMKWNEDKGNVLIYGEGVPKNDEGTVGISFLDSTNVPMIQHNRAQTLSNEGLRTWVKNVNRAKMHIREACFSFLIALLQSDGATSIKKRSLYLARSWPESLLDTVQNIAGKTDDHLWHYFEDIRRTTQTVDAALCDKISRETVELAQSLFELSLDALVKRERERLTVEDTTILIYKARTARWAKIAGDLLNSQLPEKESTERDQIALRFLWANSVFAPMLGAQQTLLLECFESLRGTIVNFGDSVIELPNCKIISEISSTKAEREISKIRLMDFFTNILDPVYSRPDRLDEDEKLSMKENLELILDPQLDTYEIDEEGVREVEEVTKFLEGSTVVFKLFLWDKLRLVYGALKSQESLGQALKCRLQCFIIIIGELTKGDFQHNDEENRQFIILRTMHMLEDVLANLISESSAKWTSFDAIQDRDLLSDAMKAIGVLLRLLHTYSFYEDAISSGEVPKISSHSYRLLTQKMRLMIVRAWTLMYLLYRASSDLSTSNLDIRSVKKACLDLLCAIHQELGARHYCKLSDHLFIKIHLRELLDFDLDGSELDLVQCLKCRFKFDISNDLWPVTEHETDAVPLDRETALRIFPFVLLLVERRKSAQGIKAELKQSLDELMKVIGEPNEKDARFIYNKSRLDEYLDSHIHPLMFYATLRGEGMLNTVNIRSDFAEVASKGFYFQQAMVALIRYRYAKKTANPRIEDVDAIIKVLHLNIICGQDDHWETWYRLAQAYELLLEDDMTWSAEKINNKKDDIVKLEKRIILCYMMALATSVCDVVAVESEEHALRSMFTNFGIRLYSACRPPLQGSAFIEGTRTERLKALDNVMSSTGQPELPFENVVKMAIIMFKNSIADGSEDWKNYYMLGKCKAHLEFSAEDILDDYAEAINMSKKVEKNNDLIFEPHHKLVTAAYNAVKDEILDIAGAVKALQATSYMPKDTVCPKDNEAFVRLIIEILTRIRSADKPKWHHRMTYRLARIHLDEWDDVAAAYNELKTMFANKNTLLAIWKPPNERPGRHFVYAHHYIKLYIELLGRLNDKATLESIGKKLKKGGTSICWKFMNVWLLFVETYTKVLRKVLDVPDGAEEELYSKTSYDEFMTYSTKIEEYFEDPANQTNITYELLRDVFDLKKLNMGLAVTTVHIDLLGDVYAVLYQETVPIIQKLAAAPKPTSITATPPSSTNPMALHNLMDAEPSSKSGTDSTPNPVLLAAAHSKLDDQNFRGKITKPRRVDLNPKINSMFKNRTSAIIATTANPKATAAVIVGKEGLTLTTTNTNTTTGGVGGVQAITSTGGSTSAGVNTTPGSPEEVVMESPKDTTMDEQSIDMDEGGEDGGDENEDDDEEDRLREMQLNLDKEDEEGDAVIVE